MEWKGQLAYQKNSYLGKVTGMRTLLLPLSNISSNSTTSVRYDHFQH